MDQAHSEVSKDAQGVERAGLTVFAGPTRRVTPELYGSLDGDEILWWILTVQ